MQPRPRRRSNRRRGAINTLSRVPGLGYVAAAGLAFQVFHLVEHGAQLTYWVAHPSDAPWLTPWAQFGVDTLTVRAVPGLGGELLHLLGNLVFFGALLALAGMAVRRSSHASRSLRWSLGIQGFHVAEHALLTLSVLFLGRALGVSTAFGLLLDTGALGSSTRVWVHFSINLAATITAVVAGQQLWKAVRPAAMQPRPA